MHLLRSGQVVTVYLRFWPTWPTRKFNRRFLTLANHYLFEPVACTPAAGWEKGQVENQVGNVREWLFTPRARFADFNELNTWLEKRCEELAGGKHPSQKNTAPSLNVLVTSNPCCAQ